MNQQMVEAKTSRVYDGWAWLYDHTFGKLVERRQERAVQQLHTKPGDKVLEIGVGTGMLLRHYPRDVTVVGIDLSNGMLQKAQRKIQDGDMSHCHLVLGDAMHLPFVEGSFDHVMLAHVVSVVSDPQRLLTWARRMLKPGGRIVVLNHFRSHRPLMSWLERMANPVFIKLGWRSDLALDEAMQQTGLEVEYSFKLRSVDLWTIVVMRPKHPRTDESPASTDKASAGKLSLQSSN